MFDPDNISNLIFPDIPPPPPPRKKMANRMETAVGQHEDKYGLGAPTFSRGVSIDLITFEDDTSTAPISSDNSGTSCGGGFPDRSARSQNIVQSEQEQMTCKVHTVSQNVMASLDMFIKGDPLKSSCNHMDASESEAAHYALDFVNFSPMEDNWPHQSDDRDVNPFSPTHEAGKRLDAIPKPWSLNNSFQKDKFAIGLQFPVDNSTVAPDANIHKRNKDDNLFKSCDVNNMAGEDVWHTPNVGAQDEGVNLSSQGDRSWPSHNPFRTDTNVEIVSGMPFPKQFERCLQTSEEDVIYASADSNAAEPEHERHLPAFDTEEYADFVSFNRDEWPKVSDDIDMKPFIPGSSETEQQLYELALPHSGISDNPGSQIQKLELRREEKIESEGLSNESLESFESMEFETKAQPGTTHHSDDSSDDDEEGDYIYISPNRDSDTSSQYRVYTTTSNELQQESQKAELGSDEDNKPGLSKDRRPRLSSQRSLSDSALYNDFDYNKSRTDMNDKCTEENQMANSLSKVNIKCKAKILWSKFIKRSGKKSQQESPSQGHEQIKLSCACGGSCERVGSLVTSSEGHMWMSLLGCSWVALYNNRHILVRKFDARGIVDSLAVSVTGVLYISCPQNKIIIMLSTNLELITMSQFNKLHPRGLAISPTDGAVVACMTSQASGRVINCPTKNCLMKFAGKTAHEKGSILNKGDFLGYPLKLAINVNGYILVSDFGLNCMFVLEPGGHMLKKFSTVGDRPYYQVHVHSLTSAHDDSLYVVQGGRGRLSITRLREHQGAVVEKETSKRKDPDVYCKVRTSAVNQSGQLVVTSGCVVKYFSLDH